LTCSFAGIRGFWAWLLLGRSFSTLFIFITYFLAWFITKLGSAYFKGDYYPAGLDGKIEPMKHLTIRQVISPLYFPWTYDYYGKRMLGYDFKNWHKKIGGIFGLYLTRNRLANVFITISTLALVYFTILGMLKSPLPVVVLCLILLYPSVMKRFLPRNSIVAIPLICAFLGKGVPQVNLYWAYFAFLGLLGAFLCFNRTFMLYQPKIRARVTSFTLNGLPKDGVLVEGLIAYPVAYRSFKRIVVIPHPPEYEKAKEQVDLSIEHFDLHYAVFSDLYKTELHLGYPAIEYIKTFKLLKAIREDGDTYYIYEIPPH
jgi:hypothetical protein